MAPFSSWLLASHDTDRRRVLKGLSSASLIMRWLFGWSGVHVSGDEKGV